MANMCDIDTANLCRITTENLHDIDIDKANLCCIITESIYDIDIDTANIFDINTAKRVYLYFALSSEFGKHDEPMLQMMRIINTWLNQ